MLIIDGVTVRILKKAAVISFKMLRIYKRGNNNKIYETPLWEQIFISSFSNLTRNALDYTETVVGADVDVFVSKTTCVSN
jgi:hypothetical protein